MAVLGGVGVCILHHFFLMIFIFSIISGLQSSVNFLLYSRVTQSHMHIYILFLTLSCYIISDQIQLPVLYSRISLVIHSKGNRLHLLTPDSQSLPLPPLPLASTSLFSMSMSFFSVQRLTCAIDQIADITEITWCLSFSF